MEKSKRRKVRSPRRSLVPMNPDAAGIDVGATFHTVAVPPGRADQTVRSFRSFTGDLYALADWLKSVGVKRSAEHTSGLQSHLNLVFLLLREKENIFVNARHVMNVPV